MTTKKKRIGSACGRPEDTGFFLIKMIIVLSYNYMDELRKLVFNKS